MRQRFTLSYVHEDGSPITLYNLYPEACSEIQRAQTHLGSHGFTRTAQPHWYSQWQIDAFRREVNDGR
jgi:hypothetical protein